MGMKKVAGRSADAHRERATGAGRVSERGLEPERPVEEWVQEAVGELERRASRATLEGMARFAIPSKHALGVPVGSIRQVAKDIRRRTDGPSAHRLALALWETGVYEARLLACFVDEPGLVTGKQMDGWAKGFDNWAVCDTACFHLFDRLPDRELMFGKVRDWARSKEEFVKRASFALLASIALHDKGCAEGDLVDGLASLERALKAEREKRNFVVKGGVWALKGCVKRGGGVRQAALATAKRLRESGNESAAWVGRQVR